jgi:hypothetical protein
VLKVCSNAMARDLPEERAATAAPPHAVVLPTKPKRSWLTTFGAAAVLLAATPSGQVPMSASSWTIGPVINGTNYSPGMPPHPTADGKGGWYFDFPKSCGKQPDCSVHYVSARVAGIKPKVEVSARFSITASPDAVWNCKLIENPTEPYDPAGIASMTIMLERTGDDQTMTDTYGRTYAWAQRTVLAAGDYTVTVPLTPDKWINVTGRSETESPTQFQSLLNNLGDVAVVFGGCGFAGHGVQMQQGSARFTMTSYPIH